MVSWALTFVGYLRLGVNENEAFPELLTQAGKERAPCQGLLFGIKLEGASTPDYREEVQLLA